ncbi:MAG: hypothetical protein DI585_02945 [Pseudomonas fluorescens]|nr:MAG: hypothetical protein DI585_02945 [Pseudomonas fluorescens]
MAEPVGILENIKVNVQDLSISNTIAKLPIATEIKQIDRTFERVFDQLPYAVMKLSLGVAIIILGWIISGWVASKMNRLLSRAHMEETLAAFLASAARFMLFFSIFPLGLSIIGVSGTTMAALLGAIGLGVGFALRNTIGSIAGGLMMMVHRPMKVGDWVEYTNPPNTVGGTVKRIGIFSTEINTPEHIRVFVPNVIVWENVLRNHTYNRMRMLKFAFRLRYDTDVRAAFDILKARAVANPLILRNPEPVFSVERFEETAVMCNVDVWVRTEDRKALTDTLLLDMMETLRKHNIVLAYKNEPLPEDAVTHVVGDTAKPTPVETVGKRVENGASGSSEARKVLEKPASDDKLEATNQRKK